MLVVFVGEVQTLRPIKILTGKGRMTRVTAGLVIEAPADL